MAIFVSILIRLSNLATKGKFKRVFEPKRNQ